VRFERTIPMFERTKTVHVLDRAATAIGEIRNNMLKNVGHTRKI
jgi:ribosomal protein L31E